MASVFPFLTLWRCPGILQSFSTAMTVCAIPHPVTCKNHSELQNSRPLRIFPRVSVFPLCLLFFLFFSSHLFYSLLFSFYAILVLYSSLLSFVSLCATLCHAFRFFCYVSHCHISLISYHARENGFTVYS